MNKNNNTSKRIDDRELILHFYAFVQDKPYEDVKAEYLGKPDPKKPLSQPISNRLYMGVERLVRQLNCEQLQKGKS